MQSANDGVVTLGAFPNSYKIRNTGRYTGYNMLSTAELVERYILLNNENDIDGVLDCCEENVLFESVMNPGGTVRLKGRGQVREVLEGTMQAFSERKHRLASLLVDGANAAAETVFNGVAKAELGDGVKPGDKVAIRGATIFETRDGKITRICDYS